MCNNTYVKILSRLSQARVSIMRLETVLSYDQSQGLPGWILRFAGWVQEQEVYKNLDFVYNEHFQYS